ncbi:hypothetical protein [Cellulomonas sp. C5510]|uniref:hypothetical protein n=1 Tax=Cellulomonas sp. C5510 TaxID=2871170 RepID=UPI001C956056|nr:hypothetical protein [Cellulomonas sp. C5510]QZN84773.1 hypothetical protein K5O09_13210 [Cellulomonas sp. C5510]
MRDVALATAALGSVFFVAGVPFALLLRRARDGWVAAVCDAALLGFVVVPLGVTLWAWWGSAGAVLPAVAWLAAAVAVAWRRGAGLPVRPGRPTVAGVLAGVGWVAVAAGAGLLRLRQVNFLPWVGDMGSYVNWANEFVRTGTLDAGWPPYFPAYLAVGARLFGFEHTTVGMAAVGLLLVLGMGRLLHQLGVGRWVVLGTAAVVAVSLHPVWFSSFPVSEALVAPLMVVWLLLLQRALSEERWLLPVVGSGVVLVALCLLRANGPLVLLPLVLVLLVVLAVRSWRRWALPWAAAVATAGIAAAVSYWYGIAEIRRYYVGTQLPEFLPAGLLRQMDELGALHPRGATAVGVVTLTMVGCLVVLGLGALATRADARRERLLTERETGRRARVPRAWRPGQTAAFAVAGTLLAGVLVAIASEEGDAWIILQRMGLWLVVGGVVGTVASRWLPEGSARPVLLAQAVVVVLYLVLQDARLGRPREHAFYLYWDRYLFSEVYPGLVVLAAVALHQLLAVLGAGLRAARVPAGGREAATAVVALGSAGAIVAAALPQLDPADDREFLGGAFDLTQRLADVAETQGDDPVLWSSAGGDAIEDYFFPNTWTALARPLEYTFGLEVVNLDRSTDFAPDEQVGRNDIRIAASCAGTEAVTVFDVLRGGAPLDARLVDSGLVLEPLATETGTITYLPQGFEPEHWRDVDLVVMAWRVEVPAAARISNPICEPVPWRLVSGGAVMSVR